MTFKYENVYLNDTYTIGGRFESLGPISKCFDKTYKDFYFNQKTWEDAESYLLKESIENLLKKNDLKDTDIDLIISGDLLNQLVSSNYAISNFNIPYLGVYNACATSVESLIIAANMIDKNQIKNCICSTSSHNNAAEKQFRYPVEYGGPKPKTTTFTVTGGVSAYLSSEKKGVKITSSTIGKIVDMKITDAYEMGAVMAASCGDTINTHLKNLNETVDDYDMIYSGDLGIYGKEILKEYMKENYGIDLKNYNDTATMIYDVKHQDVYSGGSGPACLPLVAYSYLLKQMKETKLKKILLVATGALMSSTMVNEKHTIPSIAHAISLEVIS